MPEVITKAGLEDVIAGESSICYIDGERGILSYRGHNIHSLADNAQFEETAYLLWFGRLPRRSELDDLKKRLAESRRLPAPSAARTAISRLRPVKRASARFATFEHAIRRTNPAAPNSTHNAARTRPNVRSRRDSTRTLASLA